MKKIITILILLILLLSACSSRESDPTATPEPATAVPPTTEPTEVPAAPTADTAAIAAETDMMNLEALTAHPWQWVSFTGPVEQVDVETPDRYRVLFNQDNTVQIVADCNNAAGEFTEDAGALTITIGPSTLADCTPGSLTNPFLTYLGSAAHYFFEEGNLLIDLMADGGTMVLAPSDNTFMVATGEGDVAAPLFMDGDLVAHPWQWISFTGPAEQFDVEMPEAYLLQFNENNTVQLVADCNNASGSFTLTTGFSIEIGPMTMAACPPESRSDQFVALLGSAALYFYEDGNLHIDLMADGGTMVFAPADSDAMGDDGEGAISGAGDEGESAPAGALPEDITAQLDAFLQSQVYTEGGNPELAAPGLVLYVETPDGVYLDAAGVANLDDGTPIEGDDILEIGSNTKSMTIVLLMQLVEEGLISLDDPLSDYLPEQAALFEYGDQITIRQLAQHTAGLFDYADVVIAAGLEGEEGVEAGFTPEELVQVGADNDPYFAPGAEGQWHYSNTGYILLGMIIESLTGEKLADLYQTHIFDPLGLKSAIFLEGVPQPGDIDTHGYWWTKDGERLDTTNWNGSQGWAAGAVAMTAADLAIYGKALAAGELFQNPGTLQEMLVWDKVAELKVGFPYGLGLGDFAGDGSAWGHAGQTLGFQSLWLIDPENDIVVVGLTNSATYEAYAFVNVLNILEGDGALPLSPLSVLPVGDFIATTWQWSQFTNPVESIDIDETASLQLIIHKDQTVTVGSDECGAATGSYTVNGTGQIAFELDDSTFTCEADSQAGQFIQHIRDAARWYYANGNLVIELPADGGSLIFDYIPPQ